MFSFRPQCARPLQQLCLRRNIAFSSPRFASPQDAASEDALEQAERVEAQAAQPTQDSDSKLEDISTQLSTYRGFLKAMDKYRVAQPNNYISGETRAPFPMNYSFKPPNPISDAVKTQMYDQYMLDPRRNNIRVLSQRFHVSLKRVDAILRLKGLEAAFVKEKPLQTGFQWGMEMLLGVRDGPGVQFSNVHAADLLEEKENRDAERQRFQRQYWESAYDDGKEPILPAALQHAKLLAERLAAESLANKSNPRLMPRFPDTATIKSPREPVQKVTRPGRMPIHFVDIGGKFIDIKERERRIKAGGRRHGVNARRSHLKVLSGSIMGRTPSERGLRAGIKRREAAAAAGSAAALSA